MVGTSENIGNYKQRTVRVTPLRLHLGLHL